MFIQIFTCPKCKDRLETETLIVRHIDPIGDEVYPIRHCKICFREVYPKLSQEGVPIYVEIENFY